ncbi:hypothetical protein FJZ18_02825 [Candidatus Pacearchaeota archaeon]|nr:hypothetical protein [Candidatus Pacearchaeota archaeon]
MFFHNSRFEYLQAQRAKLDEILLANIPEVGIITKVLFTNEPRNIAKIMSYSITREVDTLEVTIEGIKGDRHHGGVASSTGRERALYHKGTQILQQRQIFAVSPYDCQVLSEKMGVEITPELLGANLLIEHQDRKTNYSLSLLSRGTYLCISPEALVELPRPPLATLIHHVEQQGCGVTGAAIAAHYNNPLLIAKFTEHSKSNRGIACRIEYPVQSPAFLRKGQKVFFKYPTGVSS